MALQKALDARFTDCGLTLHPDKTKIVYCRDESRRGTHPVYKFDFLGYTFRPRLVSKKAGGMGVSFLVFLVFLFSALLAADGQNTSASLTSRFFSSKPGTSAVTSKASPFSTTSTAGDDPSIGRCRSTRKKWPCLPKRRRPEILEQTVKFGAQGFERRPNAAGGRHRLLFCLYGNCIRHGHLLFAEQVPEIRSHQCCLLSTLTLAIKLHLRSGRFDARQELQNVSGFVCGQWFFGRRTRKEKKQEKDELKRTRPSASEGRPQGHAIIRYSPAKPSLTFNQPVRR